MFLSVFLIFVRLFLGIWAFVWLCFSAFYAFWCIFVFFCAFLCFFVRVKSFRKKIIKSLKLS